MGLPICAALGCVGSAAWTCKSDPRRSFGKEFTSLFLVALFCIYPPVSRTILHTFKCEAFITAAASPSACAAMGYTWRTGTARTVVGGDNYAYSTEACYRSYLREDLSVSCDAPKYAQWVIAAAVMTLLIPIGVPIFFLALLRRAANRQRRGAAAGAHLDFIRRAYEDKYYWWEVVEVVRKLVLTTATVLFLEGAASQIVVTILVSFGFLLALQSAKPYESEGDDTAALFAQITLLMTSFSALLLRVDVMDADAWDSPALDLLITLVLALIPAVALYELANEAGLGDTLHAVTASYCPRRCALRQNATRGMPPRSEDGQHCTIVRRHTEHSARNEWASQKKGQTR